MKGLACLYESVVRSVLTDDMTLDCFLYESVVSTMLTDGRTLACLLV